MNINICASTPEEMKARIVEWLRWQANNYSSAARIANRVKVKEQATAKADCLYALATMLEQAKIND